MALPFPTTVATPPPSIAVGLAPPMSAVMPSLVATSPTPPVHTIAPTLFTIGAVPSSAARLQPPPVVPIPSFKEPSVEDVLSALEIRLHIAINVVLTLIRWRRQGHCRLRNSHFVSSS
jgi:hypothetical protein